MPLTFSGSTDNRTSRNELIEEALSRLIAPNRAEVPTGPTTETARREIEKICADFAASFKEAEASPHIGEARRALHKAAEDATALAGHFRQNTNMLMVGAATDNPADTAEQKAANQEEVKSAQDELLAAARNLDRISEKFRARIARWEGKETGRLRTYQMVHGNPAREFTETAAQLFLRHRPSDLDAGVAGDFYTFIRLLYEAATGRQPSDKELLSACRAAVKTVHDEQ